jgi:membrane-associated phospholipid phosphatase
MVLTRHWLLIFADFGEIAVIGPAFLAACAALLLYRRRRDAILWTLALAACAVVTVISKTFLGRFEISLFDHSFRSGAFPSGHASVSFVFYIGLAALLWCGSRSPFPRVLAIGLVSLQAMIVISVYLLRWHPIIDIVAGLFLGAACLGAAYCSAVPRPATVGELGGLAVVVAAAIMAFHGERLDDKKLVDRLLTGTIGEAVPSALPDAERHSPTLAEQPG